MSEEWNRDQGDGESVLRKLKTEDMAMADQLVEIRTLVAEMWAEADGWHGPYASSHYRSRIRERAEALGVKLK